MMGHHGVTAGLQLSHVTAADGTAEYQSRFTCCLLSCFLLYRYQIPPRECQGGADEGVEGESHKAGRKSTFTGEITRRRGMFVHVHVWRCNGQGREEIEVRRGDDELKMREVFVIMQTKAVQTKEKQRMCCILSNGPFLLIILSLSSSLSHKAQIISS